MKTEKHENQIDTAELDSLNHSFSSADPQKIIIWALNKFQSKMSFACSFGLEDVYLIHLFSEIGYFPRIFFLDTGRLHPETYNTVDAIRNHYKISIETWLPNQDQVQMMTRNFGYNQMYHSIESRKECCRIRKIQPLYQALKNQQAWITGLRKEQSPTREKSRIIEYDNRHNHITKINPLINHTSDQIWRHIKRHKIPYNSLHDHNFPSIGCAPCTRAILPGEDIRAGRWWWEDQDSKECGLHDKKDRNISKHNGGKI